MGPKGMGAVVIVLYYHQAQNVQSLKKPNPWKSPVLREARITKTIKTYLRKNTSKPGLRSKKGKQS
jgi:hypothetical protein